MIVSGWMSKQQRHSWMEGAFPPPQHHLVLAPSDIPAVRCSQPPLQAVTSPCRLEEMGWQGSQRGHIHLAHLLQASPRALPAPACCCQLTWGSFLLENGAQFPPNIPVLLPLHFQFTAVTWPRTSSAKDPRNQELGFAAITLHRHSVNWFLTLLVSGWLRAEPHDCSA